MFHVTARAVYDRLLFEDAVDRRVFLCLLRRLHVRFGLECLAYCLMGTHYHLFLHGTTDALPDLMRRLNGAYAQHFNERHRRHGHLFGQRYTARAVLDEEHLERLYGYIAENPAKAGLCAPGERWPWMWFSQLGEPVRTG